VIPGFDDGEYATLIRGFAPRPIRSEAQLDATEGRINELLALEQRSSAQDEYLDLLGNLVRDWERDHVEIPPVSGVELVRFLLDQRGLPDGALTPIFGARSIVSEVLAGKRALQAKHIQQLAAFFSVSPASFFPITTSAGKTRSA
jgi:HTH-type transcriptional regulator/antitoxin HigA